MKPRWVWHLLRVVLTASAIVIVVQFVQLENYVRIRSEEGERLANRSEIREIERGAGRVVIRWKNGEVSQHPGESVSEHEGFVSLFERADKLWFFLILAAYFVPFTLMGLRWWLLLRGHGFRVPFSLVFLMNYAGIFFNNFLPGGVGGDLTKAFLAASGEERKAAVVGTILLDRIVGLVAMILMGAACVRDPHPRARRLAQRRGLDSARPLKCARSVGVLAD